MRTQPVEDIDAVLGRFHAWAGSGNAAEKEPGIRELSCEEALQSNRYRWRGGDKKLGAEQRPGAAGSSREIPKLAPERTKPTSVKACAAKRGAAKKVHVKSHAAKITPVDKSIAHTPAAMKTGAKTSFREVLTETIKPAEVVVAAQAIELTRQVAISIRLAPAERALIKTRAAEAGISASAYIRQCALEVEQLRAQVQQAIAAMEGKAPAQLQASAPGPGFFSRLSRKLFAASAQAVALRA